MDFRAARDFLLAHRQDYASAYRDFEWPKPEHFNWALDWFDVIARGNDRPGLWVIDDDGTETILSFNELSRRSDALASWLRANGVRRGDATLLMLGNRAALWECMLALIKLGAVIIPSSTLLTPADLSDRVSRGNVAHVIAESVQAGHFAGVSGAYSRVAVGDRIDGWLHYDDFLSTASDFTPDGLTRAADPLFLYFTSGTTAQPKLVEHTHASYPIGHLSTMYWIALQPGDVHLNLAGPGWAKHAWSNIFAPWNAEATVLILNTARFSAAHLLDTLTRCSVTSFCAPPTVWRMLIQEDLTAWKPPLREALSAGEPLNPEVIGQVRQAWDLTIRDGYGQTETTAQVGNSSGQQVKAGSMGRPLPGYAIELIDPASGGHGDQGEICINLSDRPVGVMVGYRDRDQNDDAMRGGYYHTGDVASRDGDGYITYIGRSDDVFKSSDYRISPFELESVLIEHPAVAEAAVVPSPDAIRLAVPKAFIALGPGHAPSGDVARSIFEHSRGNLAGYKRVRRLEFAELPKTVSGKIRRVDLRARENTLRAETANQRAEHEYWEEDFPDLR
ncbi:MAG TPA: AMP-binding protein [Candidatus Saccharimonadales bacterium]|nr:AMP-binding protein [Candidatus Saccharimonadales bacterium]